MNAAKTIVKALAAGSAANFRPNVYNSPDHVTDPYFALKELIERKYDGVDPELLDIAPGSAERQEVLESQLKTSGAVDDGTVLRQAEAVLEAVRKYRPSAEVAAEPTEPND